MISITSVKKLLKTEEFDYEQIEALTNIWNTYLFAENLIEGLTVLYARFICLGME